MSTPQAGGLVVLVGAGPGDPGLATLAARDWLKRADVVFYDRLVPPGLLACCRQEAEKVYVGKAPGRGGCNQQAINERLVARAREGKLVVRLKGGDPFLFGRGGEEAEALAEAGVPFRVVPGVTAALAAGAGAGIPLTDRRLASTVAFVTGQEDPDRAGSRIDWSALARIDTVVLYMGVGNLRQVVARLVEAGRAPDTPVAVVAMAGTPRQRTVVSTLADLPAAAASAGIEPPAVAIIGAVAALHERLAWMEKLPLFGRTVLVTRPRGQAEVIRPVGDLSRLLGEQGAAVIECPAIEIAPPADLAPVDEALRGLERFDVVAFTSVNGVRAFVEGCRRLGLDARALGRAKVAAVGPATAAALREHFLEPDVVPTEFTTEALARAMQRADLRGRRVLLVRGDLGGAVLPEALRQGGAVVQDVTFYRTVAPARLEEQALSALRGGRVDWVTFTSPSGVENFLSLVRSAGADIPAKARLAAIGPVTAEAIRRGGLPAPVTAGEHTIEGIVRAMVAAGG